MMHEVKAFLFENTNVRQTVAKNTFWLTFSNVVGRLIRALVVIYAARKLGVEGWGAFSYVVGIAAFLTIFSDIGLTQLISREASRNPDERKKYLATAFFIKLALLIVLIPIFLAVAPFLATNKEILLLLPLVVLITVFDALRDLSMGMVRALERMEIEAAVNVFTNISIAVFGFLFLYLNPTTYLFAIAYIIGTGLGFGASVIALRKYFWGFLKNFSRSSVKPMVASALPFGLLGLMGVVMINTDIIMVNWFEGVAAVGLYAAAQKIITVLYIIPGLLATSAFPTMSRLALTDGRRFKEVLEKTLRILTIAFLPLTAGGVVLAGPIMDFIFGIQYGEATEAFRILILTLPSIFVSMAFGNTVFAYNGEKKFIAYSAMGTIGNVVFNALLIPVFGIEGAALSTVINQFVITVYLWVQTKKIVSFSFLPHVWKPLIGVAGMFVGLVAGLATHMHVLLIVPLGALIYFLILLALKEKVLADIKSLVVNL